jgi:hypothetical protein
LYCLNTESKIIEINNDIYFDWDELNKDDIQQILNKLDETNKKRTCDIHKYFDGGFHGSTIIELENGMKREIKDVQVGDILSKGEKVRGVVEIDGEQLMCQYECNLGDGLVFQGGVNLNICDKNLANILSTLNLSDKYFKINEIKEKKLYHLVTDKKTFFANNIHFYHYDSSLELFLERYREKLLSMKYV